MYVCLSSVLGLVCLGVGSFLVIRVAANAVNGLLVIMLKEKSQFFELLLFGLV